MEAKFYDTLGDLEPEVKERLESTDMYQQFLLKRIELKKAASDEFKRSGRLTSDGINALRKDVEALGTQVLDEIRRSRLILNEPSFEDLQAMRKMSGF